MTRWCELQLFYLNQFYRLSGSIVGMNVSTKKAMIAMSGGVDSSVAAHLSMQAGYSCTGATMKLLADDLLAAYTDAVSSCCSLDDINDARRVCNVLEIPHYVFNLTNSFEQQVIKRFVQSYQSGATPNPCIDCNRYLKFEELQHRARQTNFDYLVTGHYARIIFDENSGRYLLKRGAHTAKDQSYVLYTMTQDQLAHTLFPLGDLSKQQVRQLAQNLQLPTAHKHESQDICFVPSGDYAQFIRDYLKLSQAPGTGMGTAPGNIVGPDGKVLGQHNGIINYTIGQRKGLGVAAGKPLYVTEVNARTNTVVLAEKGRLQQTEALLSNINLISTAELTQPTRVMTKHRYRCTEQAATAVQVSENSLKVVFDKPLHDLTKGQALVMYNDELVLGGGVIDSVKSL
jgi:tRNA-specific 2-thiouridylase